MDVAQLVAISTPLATLALAVLAGWYAWETRAIRIQGSQQLQLLRAEGHRAERPYLVASVADFEFSVAQENIQNDPELSDDEKTARLDNLQRSGVRYVGLVHNPTSRLPVQISAVIRDPGRASFIFSHSAKEVAERGEHEKFYFPDGAHVTKEQAAETLAERYGLAREQIRETVLEGPSEGFIVAIYQNLDGRTFAVRRPFEIDDDGDIIHRPSTFHDFAVF